MKISRCNHREHGLTLMELFVVMTVITFFILIFMSGGEFNNARPRALRIQCVNNLKQDGLATRIWEGDHNDKYPMFVSGTNGGTMEFTAGPEAWRHFQVMSNELSTPKILICPEDSQRWAATNFNFLNNSNLSYFVGLDASEADPQGLLFGDRNITNGTPIKNGVLELTANKSTGWTDEIHRKVGNIVLSDGSVQQISSAGLRNAVENTFANPGTVTNRLQMPVLGP